jgi:hypothetical protein
MKNRFSLSVEPKIASNKFHDFRLSNPHIKLLLCKLIFITRNNFFYEKNVRYLFEASFFILIGEGGGDLSTKMLRLIDMSDNTF